jgi:hypothetical protein
VGTGNIFEDKLRSGWVGPNGRRAGWNPKLSAREGLWDTPTANSTAINGYGIVMTREGGSSLNSRLVTSSDLPSHKLNTVVINICILAALRTHDFLSIIRSADSWAVSPTSKVLLVDWFFVYLTTFFSHIGYVAWFVTDGLETTRKELGRFSNPGPHE